MLLVCPWATAIAGGSHSGKTILRQYPVDGARDIPVVTKIGITLGKPVASSANLGYFTVTGSVSGQHSGSVLVALDNQTVIFTPATTFTAGETVSVQYALSQSDFIVTHSFSFQTRGDGPSKELDRGKGASPMGPLDSIPPPPPPPPPPNDMKWSDLFSITVSDNPTPGKMYLAALAPVPQITNHLLILNEKGQIVDSGFAMACLDFEVQENGMMTYFAGSDSRYYGIDTLFRVIDTFASANGYLMDGHELRVYKDGSYSVIAISQSTVNLSDFIPGAPGSFEVLGSVVQTFDRDHNEIFEWRGIDHFNLLEELVNVSVNTVVDFEHANSVDMDSTGDYILSNRTFSEITKISGETGDMVWRLGGAHNQFRLIGDTAWFSQQHHAHWIPNGNLVLFDNGVTLTGNYESRAVEYAIDESKMTATLVWQYSHNPPVTSPAMGSVQRLPNGNTFIGWGMAAAAVTEVTPDNKVVFDVQAPFLNSYRVIKVPDGPPIHSAVHTTPTIANTALEVKLTADGVDISVPASNSSVSLTLSDVCGRLVKNIFSGGSSEAGMDVHLDTKGLAPGAYFCCLSSASGSRSVPIMIVH